VSYFKKKIRGYRWQLERVDAEVHKWWFLWAVIFGVYFAIWWLVLRPGVFSYDSGYYINEVISGVIDNRKPFLYARFLQLTSIGGRYFELSTVVQVSLIVLLLSRAFAVAMASRTSLVIVIFCGVLVLNPYVVLMALYIQNDILFCFAIIGILVETLYVMRTASIGKAGFCMIAILSPMAFGFRENGLIFLPVWWCILPFLFQRPIWSRVVLISIFTTALALTSGWGVSRSESFNMFYPAVVHESIRLALPFYGHAAGSVLSPETTEAIGFNKVASAVPYYLPLYWDSIAFFQNGPKLADLPRRQQQEIVRSFLIHDFAQNLPSVMGHRLEIFIAEAMARGEYYVDPYAVPKNISGPLANDKIEYGNLLRENGLFGGIVKFSILSRAWTWNAMVGVFVVGGMILLGLWRRDVKILLVCMLLFIQGAAIFALSPAPDCRYVFMLYLAPLLLLVRIDVLPINRTVQN